MRRLDWNLLDESQRAAALARPRLKSGASPETVLPIVQQVRAQGDAAVLELTRRFDAHRLERLAVTAEELAAAHAQVGPRALEDLKIARDNLLRFHRGQRRAPLKVETAPGVWCERVTRPIGRVGLYVPGGTAPLVSTTLMLTVPMGLAGCPVRVLCTPPRADGSVDPHLLVAAALGGLKVGELFKAGGAQAVAAMAYGTESIPKVDKVFGPGNAWVTAAKLLVAQDADGAAIDMPAGPSEVMVVADRGADPRFVAADLLSQAEHGTDSHVVLVSTDETLLDAVQAELSRQLAALPRKDIARESLEASVMLQVASLEVAVAVANRYAPEHLILQVADAAALVPRVQTAGSVFVGAWTPESMGDYASGTNHVLPTYGFARAYSGLSTESFERTMTVQSLTAQGLAGLGPTVERLAELEGLSAHARAITVRLDAAGKQPAAEVPGPASFAREAVRAMTAYTSARSTTLSAPVLLDANENPESPVPGAALNRYPAPQPPALVNALAAHYGVRPEQLVVGRGSDDVIDWLVRGFCEANRDAIVITPPTYGVYGVAAKLQGAGIVEVPLAVDRDFAVDVPKVTAALDAKTTLLFICSPNNPTATVVPLPVLESLATAMAKHGLLVVDEAYLEFSTAPSATALLARHRNVVVLRTLSKAYGLAGARCGVGLGDAEVIALLQKIRAPYPLPAPAVDAVLPLLTPEGHARAKASVARILAERARLVQRLQALPGVDRVYPSDANFVVARVRDAAATMRACREAGVIIRDRSHEPGLARCVRISVGTPQENDLLLKAMGQVNG
ncbi:MAG: histidinol dehydrogenase [Myxococcaceae bacterium]|nr:histidinol dehydrogenase [Myxococcaceae bacterium]